MIGIGVRLALTGNRIRLVVTAVAVSFSVAFLLACLGALPTRQAQLARLDSRGPATVSAAKNATLMTSLGTWYRGKPLSVREVAAEGTAPVPPGISRIPGPGQVIASPQLAKVLRGPRASELATRVPGALVGTIGRAGLTGPHELFAYVGVTPSQLDGPEVVTSWGHHSPREKAPFELRVAAWLGALGLLLPVLVLVATSTRLSAAARDRRLAAIRLVGATPRQARWIAAGESLLAGGFGTVAGLVVFYGLRGPATRLLPLPSGLYASDLQPGHFAYAAVVLGVPLLAVGAGLAALRKVVLSPLGVRRTARTGNAGWFRLTPLVVGLAMLLILRVQHDAWPPGTPPGTTLLLGGGALTLVGLAVAAAPVARLAGLLLGRLPSVDANLAARRIEADPGASARVVTGSVLVVFVAAWLLAFLPVLQTSQGDGLADGLKQLPKGLLVGDTSGSTDLSRAGAVKGVRWVLALGHVQLVGPHYGGPNQDLSQYVGVGRCADLAKAIGHDPGCAGATAFEVTAASYAEAVGPQGAPLRPGERATVLDDNGSAIGHVQLPTRIPTLSLPPLLAFAGVLQPGLYVDPSLVPARALGLYGTSFAIQTDGSATSVERVRAALPTQAAFAETLQERESGAVAVYLGYQRAVRIGIALALLVGAASLAVTTADVVRERRRSMAAMVAFGTPLRTLRISVLLQMAAPMLSNVLVALGAAVIASTSYLSTADSGGAGLPWRAWSLTALAAVGAVLVATLTTLPLLRAAGRPEALRAE